MALGLHHQRLQCLSQLRVALGGGEQVRGESDFKKYVVGWKLRA